MLLKFPIDLFSMLTRSEKLSYIVNVNEPQPGFQGLIECIPNKIVDAIYLMKCIWRWSLRDRVYYVMYV